MPFSLSICFSCCRLLCVSLSVRVPSLSRSRFALVYALCHFSTRESSSSAFLSVMRSFLLVSTLCSAFSYRACVIREQQSESIGSASFVHTSSILKASCSSSCLQVSRRVLYQLRQSLPCIPFLCLFVWSLPSISFALHLFRHLPLLRLCVRSEPFQLPLGRYTRHGLVKFKWLPLLTECSRPSLAKLAGTRQFKLATVCLRYCLFAVYTMISSQPANQSIIQPR